MIEKEEQKGRTRKRKGEKEDTTMSKKGRNDPIGKPTCRKGPGGRRSLRTFQATNAAPE